VTGLSEMTNYRFSSEWIHQLESQYHWQLYWHQLKLLQNKLSKGDKIAEIGVGSKFTYNYLKDRGYQIHSIDIDADKNPDYTTNIVNVEKLPSVFNVILAFNIFEHIPYGDFLKVVSNFDKWGIKKLFISLPYNRKIIFKMQLQLGRYFNRNFQVSVRKGQVKSRNHHWELDFKSYTKKRLITDLNEANYNCREYLRYRNNACFYFESAK